MDFSNDKAIYIQIAERLCDEILAGKYREDERVPSVREYAVLLEVNTNTTVKSYDQLASEGIIYNKRGLAISYHQEPSDRSRRLASRSL